jgi:hypothetical protein
MALSLHVRKDGWRERLAADRDIVIIGRDSNSKVKQCVLWSGTGWDAHVQAYFGDFFHSCVKLSIEVVKDGQLHVGCVGRGVGLSWVRLFVIS